MKSRLKLWRFGNTRGVAAVEERLRALETLWRRNFQYLDIKYVVGQTAAPTTGDDADDGYSPGSWWVDETGDAAYLCLDSTVGAAVWRQITVSDFSLEVALGHITGYSKINKYGEALDCDSGVATDIWDGADGTTSTDVWVPPTQARIHNLASTSANDTSAGTGMRTCLVYGLTDWDTAETSETVTLNGTSDVATSNAYVIIYRIVGVTFGSGGTNAGIVTATAVTDATVTAAIQAGEGQTLMAIYAVPSTQTLHLKHAKCTVRITGPAANVIGYLLVKENADQSTAGFVTKEKFSFSETKDYDQDWAVPKSFTGPCIAKLQVTSNANNTIVTGKFDAYIVNN